MEKKYTPCGGCGAEHPDDRCIGCGHIFEPFNPDLLKVMQDAEATKESDLQKVKEVIRPRLTIKSNTGETHTIHKYILDNEGKQHIWCNDWYGHHVIGQDCEWESGQ